MKTNKKLDLSKLKVESFVTSLEGQKINTVKGGTTLVCSVVASVVLSYLTYEYCDKIPDPKKNGDGICNTNYGCGTRIPDGTDPLVC
jgi:hypothetical protein